MVFNEIGHSFWIQLSVFLVLNNAKMFKYLVISSVYFFIFIMNDLLNSLIIINTF